jgi:4-diphosphocytidyl-2-C-methyl-D-erythritol kinase
MTAALGFAKVNVTLRVSPMRDDGLHLIESLVTTIDWADRLVATPSANDSLVVGGAQATGVPNDRSNLVWKAVDAHRRDTGKRAGTDLALTKHIPAAAGLGGGSADAAAALRLADSVASTNRAAHLAAGLGADVPFALKGGWAKLSGHGQRVDPVDASSDFALALVVPPIQLSTPEVYRAWDMLGAPIGPEMDDPSLPASLRNWAPLINDLYPAAVHLDPQLGEWRHRLEDTWNRGVMMSGSGSTLFSFFPSREDAEEAVDPFRGEARAVRAATPVPHGARIDQG